MRIAIATLSLAALFAIHHSETSASGPAIARVWHGRVSAARADDYAKYLAEVVAQILAGGGEVPLDHCVVEFLENLSCVCHDDAPFHGRSLTFEATSYARGGRTCIAFATYLRPVESFPVFGGASW